MMFQPTKVRVFVASTPTLRFNPEAFREKFTERIDLDYFNSER